MNRDLLIEAMAAFENGDDGSDNPFDIEQLGEVLPTIEPFLMGGAVPDTYVQLVEQAASVEDGVMAGAVAGMLQGLWIGFEYARRDR